MAGLENVFFEPQAGQWFYAIEYSNAPRDSWDWRDYADCFGPFTTLESANEHLYNSRADVSGSTVLPMDVFIDDPGYQKLRFNAALPSLSSVVPLYTKEGRRPYQ
jgi:hypothetical protein